MKRLRRSFGCPVEFAVELLGGKWKTVILARLKDAPLRYGELRRLIPELSDKMLTERLADLQALELVVRQAGGTYTLGAKAETLRPVLEALYAWGAAEADGFGVTLKPAG